MLLLQTTHFWSFVKIVAFTEDMQRTLSGLLHLQVRAFFVLENADDVDWPKVAPLINQLELAADMAHCSRAETRSEAASKKRGRDEPESASLLFHKPTEAGLEEEEDEEPNLSVVAV